MIDIFETSLSDIRRKQKSIVQLFPSFYDRVAAVEGKGGVKLVSQDSKKWIFKVPSGTKSGAWYEVIISFQDPAKLLKVLCNDRRVWTRGKIDREKLAYSFLERADVKISCNCPAQLYWGGAYILTKKRAKFGRPENRPPKIRNSRQYGAHCKHIEAVVKALPSYITTAAKWINTTYGNLLKKIEGEQEEEED